MQAQITIRQKRQEPILDKCFLCNEDSKHGTERTWSLEPRLYPLLVIGGQ